LCGDADYLRLGLSKTGVEPWEDGMRTSGAPGTYEWWYFDAKLEDGSALVVVFFTKSMLEVTKPLSPLVTVTLTDPSGRKVVDQSYSGRPEDFSASREGCDVRIGKNRITGDLHSYRIVLDLAGVKADLAIAGMAPAWRPGAGQILFERGSGRRYFAWLPSVPSGRISGSLEASGERREVSGSAYHDHNWGDASILDLMHDWYWGRAEVGPYTVISSYITANASYGGGSTPIFLLARGGKVLAEDGSKVRFSAEGAYRDEYTGKPAARKLVYDYDDGQVRYRVTYEREGDIERVRFIDKVSGLTRVLAGIAGFDGAYIRFTGKVTVERLEDGVAVETATRDAAVWELMYLGHAPADGAR
jgi:hypothetical protein